MIRGKLCVEDGKTFIEGSENYFADRMIWDGYVSHWAGKRVCARELDQRDYKYNEKIIIMWPDEPEDEEPYVDLYYNERLVKYPASLFGHNAININGNIYNFSHLLNENEIMTPEEFLYRPALGEFAPSPNSDKFEILDDGTAYYDKFGRNFMRTVHVLRIKGIDTHYLSSIYDKELEIIHKTPVNPKKPEKYKDFSFFNRSCSTIIRDGLLKYGFKKLNGVLPRDLFVSVIYNSYKQQEALGIELEQFTMPQLKVPEAPYSKMTPLMNIQHMIQLNKINKEDWL